MKTPKNQTRPAVFASAAITIVIGWLALSAVVLAPVLPSNPITVADRNERLLQTVFPEGWKFFTRSPREPRNLLFAKRGDAWESAFLGPNARLKYILGTDRKARAQGVEYGLIMTSVDPSAWKACDDTSAACLEAAEVPDTVANVSPGPTLCGLIGFVRREPIPWAWRDSPSLKEMPGEAATIHVLC